MPDPGIGAGAAAGAFEPIEHLGGRVDLVVVLAARQRRQLMEVFGEPPRLLGQVDKAVLDHRDLGVHPHDLVGGRLVAANSMATVIDQVLDQLGARGLVLDQHGAGTV